MVSHKQKHSKTVLEKMMTIKNLSLKMMISKNKVSINPDVYSETDPNLGYFTKAQDATSNFKMIIQKYLKKISDHYSIIMAPDEAEQKHSNVTAVASHSSAFQRQKRIERYILQSDKMYAQLKKELKMAIHRIIRDRYRKTVGGKLSSQHASSSAQQAGAPSAKTDDIISEIRAEVDAAHLRLTQTDPRNNIGVGGISKAEL